MKKFMLALTIFTVFVSVTKAKSSITIYGVMDTGIIYTKDIKNKNINVNNKFELKSSTIQGSRIGFKGIEDLGAGIKTLFNIETSFVHGSSFNTTNNILFHRRSVIGLNSNFGTILLGRQTNFADIISAYTSIADFGSFTSSTGSDLSRLQGARTNNSITYTTNNLNGFTGSILYGFGETLSKISSGKAFGIGTKYEYGPLSLGINYYQNNTNITSIDTNIKTNNIISSTVTHTLNNESATILNIVASYQFRQTRIYTNWSQVQQKLNSIEFTHLTIANRLTNATLKLSEKADMYELGTAYQLNSKIKLLASIQYTEAKFNGLDGKGRLTQISLGTNYLLSKRTGLYIVISNIHSINMANPGAIGANPINNDIGQTAIGIGIKHKF